MRLGNLEINWIKKQPDEIWVTAKGEHLSISSMSAKHLRNCLRMIMQYAYGDFFWSLGRDNRLVYTPHCNQIKKDAQRWRYHIDKSNIR